MALQILELGKQFRPSTSVLYPPFKNGRYMEEYFYDYIMANKNNINSDRVYIPVFWTNIQIHPNFQSMKDNFNILHVALNFFKLKIFRVELYTKDERRNEKKSSESREE